MNCGKKSKNIYIYIYIYIPDGIPTRNRPVCWQGIYPLDYHLIHFLRVHSVLTTVKYMFVSIKSCDLKISLLLLNVYINKDYQ